MFNKIFQAQDILVSIDMPRKQQNEMSALTLLALASIKEDTRWADAKNVWVGIREIKDFMNSNYGKSYAENTRETIRKDVIHQFRDGAIIEDNGLATNSPKYKYRLTKEFFELIKNYGQGNYWVVSLCNYMEKYESLKSLYSSKKAMQQMPVKINNKDFSFSPGKHNNLQKAIIEEFAPRFGANSEVLYVGDTTDKALVLEKEKLEKIGFELVTHDKMPDVILYSKDKNWLYFVEAVTSVGPMSPKRIIEIKEMTKHVEAGKIFVTAFLDLATYKKFITEIAWETEVWLAELPEHMIHLNGDRFIGPR